MKSKPRVLLLAGGQSEEHEVSLSSARNVLAAAPAAGLDITPLVITRQGRWLTDDDSQRALTAGRATEGGTLALQHAQVAQSYDVVFPLIHGPHGEDGTLQGMLELAGIPYVGSGVLGSAVCMDKVAMKSMLKAHGIPQVDSCLVTRHHYTRAPEAMLDACERLSAPWFVKPANLGSSVGISKAKDRTALRHGIESALHYDRRVIVEAGAIGARELEIGILGNDDPQASTVGEITYNAEFYDYDTKYTEGRADLHIPANISKSLAARIKDLALKAFSILDCAGFARVDFFYLADRDELLLNEVNTIPGFTPTSMFTKLWEHAGMSYAKVVRRLIDLAIERHAHTR